MAALIREKVPDHAAFVFVLTEAYELVVIGIQVRRVLVRTALLGFNGRKPVPFLARDLAPPAGRAPGGVYEE
jgi:hypothetical protein